MFHSLNISPSYGLKNTTQASLSQHQAMNSKCLLSGAQTLPDTYKSAELKKGKKECMALNFASFYLQNQYNINDSPKFGF